MILTIEWQGIIEITILAQYIIGKQIDKLDEPDASVLCKQALIL